MSQFTRIRDFDLGETTFGMLEDVEKKARNVTGDLFYGFLVKDLGVVIQLRRKRRTGTHA